MLALFLKITKGLKIDVFDNPPLSFDAPSPENPCEYPHKPYIVSTLQSHWASSSPLIV